MRKINFFRTRMTRIEQIFTNKISVLSFFIYLYVLPSLAQQNKINSEHSRTIDSLLYVLKTDKEDTNKINHLNDIGWGLMYNNPDTAIILSNQALILSEKAVWKKGKSNSYGNLGAYNYLKAEYSNALDYYFKALKLDEELENKNGIAGQLGHIGIVYMDQGDYPKALEYYLKALKIAEENEDINRIAIQIGNIGLVYADQKDYSKALNYYLRALKMSEQLGNKNHIASWLGNIGIAYMEQGNYTKTLEYYFKALKIAEELNNKNTVAAHLGNIGNVYYSLRDYTKAMEYYLKSLKIRKELGSKNLIATTLGNIGSLYTTLGKYKAAYRYLYRALVITDSIGAKNRVKDHYEKLSDLYEKSSIPLPDTLAGKILNKEEMRLRALYYFKSYMTLRDALFSEEKDKEITRKELTYQFEKKEAMTKAEQDKQRAVSVAENRKQKIVSWSVGIGLLFTVVFAVFIFRERRKSDKLLLNILPAETASELKSKGKAQPKQYEMATVMFTDFKGFTQFSEKMSAKELVDELDFIFKKFDEIISRYPIEKIKTIGDSYMCAGGLPVANTTNQMDVVLAALDIKMFMELYKQNRISEGKPFFEVRIGVHTGAVVAGVVGEKKFAYDIWGDTVNTASRMESSGEAGKVNISGETYNKILDIEDFKNPQYLKDLKFTYRGKIPAKNKGEVEMYFVEHS